MIMEMLKEVNTLSALDIIKLIDNGVNVSTSTIRRALKMRKHTYKKTKYCYNDLNIESNESKRIALW